MYRPMNKKKIELALYLILSISFLESTTVDYQRIDESYVEIKDEQHLDNQAVQNIEKKPFYKTEIFNSLTKTFIYTIITSIVYSIMFKPLVVCSTMYTILMAIVLPFINSFMAYYFFRKLEWLSKWASLPIIYLVWPLVLLIFSTVATSIFSPKIIYAASNIKMESLEYKTFEWNIYMYVIFIIYTAILYCGQLLWGIL